MHHTYSRQSTQYFKKCFPSLFAFGAALADTIHQFFTEHWTQSSVFHTCDSFSHISILSQQKSVLWQFDSMKFPGKLCFYLQQAKCTQIQLNLHETREAWIMTISFTCRSVPVNCIYCNTKQINLLLEAEYIAVAQTLPTKFNPV